MRTIYLLLMLGTLALSAGCAVKSNNAVNGNVFQPKVTVATEKQQQKFAEAMLELERTGRRDIFSISKFDYLVQDGMVEAAKLLIDENLSYGSVNSRKYKKRMALTLLIENGHFEYIVDYWDELYNQHHLIHSYDLDFILPASNYVATNDPTSDAGKYVLKQLAKYWVHGCSEADIKSRKGGLNVWNTLLGSCHERPDLSVKWFLTYVQTWPKERSEQVHFASKIGDYYLSRKAYDTASGWYLAAINLASEDSIGIDWNSFDRAIRHLFRRGVPFELAMSEAMKHGAKIQKVIVERSKKRLELISGAGIETVPLYEETAGAVR